EVEGAAAATTQGVPWAAPPLRAMDQGPLHNFDTLAPQVCQGLQPLVTVLHFQRDVLQGVVAGIAVLFGEAGMREQDNIVVVIGEAPDGHLTVFPHGPAPRQREPQDVAVPLHRPADVGDLDADVSHTANRKSLGHLVSLLAAGEALVRSVQGSRTGTALTLLLLALGHASHGQYHTTDEPG